MQVASLIDLIRIAEASNEPDGHTFVPALWPTPKTQRRFTEAAARPPAGDRRAAGSGSGSDHRAVRAPRSLCRDRTAHAAGWPEQTEDVDVAPDRLKESLLPLWPMRRKGSRQAFA